MNRPQELPLLSLHFPLRRVQREHCLLQDHRRFPAQALNSQKWGIFIPQDQWKEFVHDLRKHRRPWGQILHCTRTIPDSKQTLRAELSPGNCSSQSSSGNRDCTDRKEQPGCRKTWDSTFLRKQEFPRAKRERPSEGSLLCGRAAG